MNILEKEKLYNYTIEELKNKIENELKAIENEDTFKIIQTISEEETTNELLKETEDLDNKKQDLIYYLEDINEVIKEKQLEG